MMNFHADITKALVSKHPHDTVSKISVEWNNEIGLFISEIVVKSKGIETYYHYLSNKRDPTNLRADLICSKSI